MTANTGIYRLRFQDNAPNTRTSHGGNSAAYAADDARQRLLLGDGV